MKCADSGGNVKTTWVALGATNHSERERESNDYYATPPIAVNELLKVETFTETVYEPAVGGGHIADVLKANGYDVVCSDIVDRGYEGTIIRDFLNYTPEQKNRYSIVTNPPYKYATKFVQQALDISEDGVKIAMLLKVQFLESQERWRLFKNNPPVRIYPFSKRIDCSKNGDFINNTGGAIAYCWFVWVKGSNTDPIVRWVNTGE